MDISLKNYNLFDISDIYDDNRKYKFIDNKISRKKSAKLSKIQKKLKSSFLFWRIQQNF